MPRGTAKSGAKTRSKAAAGKAQAKSTKPHGKGSAFKEATQEVSEAIGFSGDAAVSKFLPMTKFAMSQGMTSETPGPTLEHAAFPHLTRVEWEALHRLAAVSGEAVIASLLSSATSDHQRQAAQEFMERELADANRRATTPARSSKNDVVKLETSTYSGEGANRLPLNRWFREV
ncbi:hypothetical protein PInf_000729 [Phytophthora infestans]|nr:hypothetical protein PInf_000729 [Phytophthora infestans]